MVRPGLEAGQRIGAELQDFTVQLLEFFVVRTEPVDLVRSATGESERHERDHHRPPPETGKGYFLVRIVSGQGKFRRSGTCLDFHTCSPVGYCLGNSI